MHLRRPVYRPTKRRSPHKCVCMLCMFVHFISCMYIQIYYLYVHKFDRVIQSWYVCQFIYKCMYIYVVCKYICVVHVCCIFHQLHVLTNLLFVCTYVWPCQSWYVCRFLCIYIYMCCVYIYMCCVCLYISSIVCTYKLIICMDIRLTLSYRGDMYVDFFSHRGLMSVSLSHVCVSLTKSKIW